MNPRLARALGRTVTAPGQKSDATTREYRACCGRRVTFCPHTLTWVKRNRPGIVNRAARRHPSADMLAAFSKAAGREITAAEVRGTIGRKRRAQRVPISKALI